MASSSAAVVQDARSNDDYTITTTVRLVQPYDIRAMNDEFQSAKLIGEKGGVGTFEITYRPLHIQQVTADPNWRKSDRKMAEYLLPRTCANWDADLKTQILSDLRKDGIDPEKLDDKTLVERVSNWALQRSRFNDQFGLWMIEFNHGSPTIPASLKKSFAENEPKGASLQQIYAQEVFGKGMYAAKTHGACTSTSTYMTTILRAIGIPTRIILTVPACDPNDKSQVKALTMAVRHHKTVQAIRLAATSNGFVNHVFNEVWVGGKWVRLNYNRLGQPIVDANYGGLITHVYTALDISDVPFAKTWGARYALEVGPKLSSVNPYQLVSAKDAIKPGVQFDNPEVPTLASATVTAVLKRGDPRLPKWAKFPDDADAFFQIKEWIKDQNYMQLRDFESGACSAFTLSSHGHPDVLAKLEGLKTSDERGGFQAFAVKLEGKLVAGVSYSIKPQNGGHSHTWRILPSVVWPG